MKSKVRLVRAALIAAMPWMIPMFGQAQNLMDVNITEPFQSTVSETIVLALNKSAVVEIGSQASEVVITNPAIADATVQTASRMIFRGVTVGQTNAFVFDSSGNQLLNLEIRVEPDMVALEDLISRHVPDARVQVEAVNDSILLSGFVDSLSQSDQVSRLANAYLGIDPTQQQGGGVSSQARIVNMLEIGARDQVLLQVRVVEMRRTLIKQLGINLSGSTSFGSLQGEQVVEAFPNGPTAVPLQDLEAASPFQNTTSFTSSNAFNVAGGALGGLSVSQAFTNLVNGSEEQSSVGVALQALERIGVVRTLAEPNIAALSGEPANFLAGGEFPVPVAQDADGGITVEFRPFGVGLGFTPIVLSEGRISLRLSTEVSELSTAGAFTGTSSANVNSEGDVIVVQDATIPALVVRRAETTVELPSGGSMMIAGLIESTSSQTVDQLPGLRNVPVLGALFRSRDFLDEQTELVIIVTPYLVEPTAQSDYRSPDEGFANASDAKTFFLGKLNRTYGLGEKQIEAEEYAAPVGFIEE
ncbi:MAG: type II and III secretion system protein family protein [Pseudomonadota bacterium]